MVKTSSPKPSAVPAPIVVIAGEELFLRTQHLNDLRRTVLGDEDPGMALVRFDETASMAEVLDECRTPSMFAAKKLVIVDPADSLLKGGGDDGAKGKRPTMTNRELLEAYLEAEQPNAAVGQLSALLILVCNSWLKTTRLHKALDKLGAVRWCDPIREPQLPAWIVKRARDAYAKAVDPLAAARLAELIGPDLQRLDNELAKLALYQPNAPTIDVAAVDALVGFQHEQQIWDMINALTEKNASVALKKIDELWQLDPKIEYTAVGAVNHWLGQVLRARELIDRRMPDGVISRELRLWPEDRARKILMLARRWGLDGAARWSRELLYVDLANKSGLGDSRHNLEKFIVRLCA